MISAVTMYFVILVQFEEAISEGDRIKRLDLLGNETQIEDKP
jgi:hypothetical protein